MKLFFALTTLFAFSACGDPGIEGAWGECDDQACLKIDDDGVLFREDGTAIQLEIFDESTSLEKIPYCERLDEDQVAWTLEGDMLTIFEDSGDPETATIVLNQNRLIVAADGQRIQFQRLDEEQSTGSCRQNRAVPLNAN